MVFYKFYDFLVNHGSYFELKTAWEPGLLSGGIVGFYQNSSNYLWISFDLDSRLVMGTMEIELLLEMIFEQSRTFLFFSKVIYLSLLEDFLFIIYLTNFCSAVWTHNSHWLEGSTKAPWLCICRGEFGFTGWYCFSYFTLS